MLFDTSLTAPVFGLRRDMNRLLDDVLTRTSGHNGDTWLPSVDIREDQQAIKIMLELPGVDPDQVEITNDNGVLNVRGEKRMARTDEENQRYYVVERIYGRFLRTFQLPKGVDDSKINAEFRNGVLTITVPKAALPQPKKIAISAAA